MIKTHPNPKNASCRVGLCTRQNYREPQGLITLYIAVYTCDPIITAESKTNCRLMTTSELLVLRVGCKVGARNNHHDQDVGND